MAPSLKIHELIINTLQGEGFNAGTPADFVRLYGCNVGCWFCDTGYSKFDLEYNPPTFYPLTFDQIISKLKSQFIVISGGEPMLNKLLPEFCAFLLDKGKKVAIETSGTSWKEVPKEVWITLSPKDKYSKFKTKDIAWSRANEYKFVVSTYKPSENLPDDYKDNINPDTPLFIQPEWNDYCHKIGDKWGRDMSEIYQLLRTLDNARLSLQTHKILGIQ